MKSRRPKKSSKGRPPRRRSLDLGERKPARVIEWPFDPGEIPEEYLEAVDDLGLFLESYDFALPEGASSKLARFSQRLAEANSIMNLTRIDDPMGIASRHLADCLVFAVCLQDRAKAKILDVGTGPGLPAIPLAIARPDWQVTALDSTAKKIAFVQAMAKELELENLHPLSERAEGLAHKQGYRASYGAVVSRATARLSVLLEWTIPFLKKDGFLFASKGSRAAQEIEAAAPAFEALGCALITHERYPTMDPDQEFSMLVIQKLAHTSSEYPRHPSQIKKDPLEVVTV